MEGRLLGATGEPCRTSILNQKQFPFTLYEPPRSQQQPEIITVDAWYESIGNEFEAKRFMPGADEQLLQFPDLSRMQRYPLFDIEFDDAFHLLALEEKLLRIHVPLQEEYVLELVFAHARFKTIHENPAPEGPEFSERDVESRFLPQFARRRRSCVLARGVMSARGHVEPARRDCFFPRPFLEQRRPPAFIHDEAMKSAVPHALPMGVAARNRCSGFFTGTVHHVEAFFIHAFTSPAHRTVLVSGPHYTPGSFFWQRVVLSSIINTNAVLAGPMDISGFYSSVPGAYVAQSFFHSFTTALLVDAAIRVWKIEDPAARQRFRLLIIFFPVVSYPLYQLINSERGTLSFRPEALFDSARWMDLELLPGTPAGVLFLALLAVTTLLFLVQELVPVVNHSLVSRRSEAKGRKPPPDSPVCKALAGFPGAKPEVLLIDDDDLLIFVTTGKQPALYLSSASVNALSEDELQTAIAHELAHIERNKRPLLIVTFLLRVVQFFNIVSLIEFRRIVQEEEIICDDRAVALTGKPEALAGTLRKFHPEREDAEQEASSGESVNPRERLEQYGHSLLIDNRIARLEAYEAETGNSARLPLALTTIAVVVMNYYVL